VTPFRASGSGRHLLRIGQDDDIAFCARQDVSRVVPALQRGDPLRLTAG
jgi:phosphosulfolactate phosphohydrolase-like enzyme